MERIKTLLLSFGLIVATIMLVKSLIFPEVWWLYLIPVFVIGFFLRKRVTYGFITGFLSGFLSYMLLLILLEDAHLDLTRISNLLFGTIIVTKLVSCFVGGILTGLAFHSGKHIPINNK